MYHVMIVDDEYKNVLLLEKAIPWDEHGFSVIATAEDGKEAFQKYQEFHPDVILVDIRMPMMDGLELIREIRMTDQRTILLVVSAYDDFGYAQSAITLGVFGYLLKPIDRRELKETMTRVYDELERLHENRSAFSQMETVIRCQNVGSQLQKLLESSGGNEGYQELADLFQTGRAFRLAFVADQEFSFARSDIRPVAGDFFYFKQKERSIALFPFEHSEELKARFREYADGCQGGPILYMSQALHSEGEILSVYGRLQELVRSCFYLEGSAVVEQGRKMAELSGDIREIATSGQIDGFVFHGQAGPLLDAVEDAFRMCKERNVNPDILREKSIYLLIRIKQSLTKVYGESTFCILRHIDYPKMASFYHYHTLKCFLLKTLSDCEEQLRELWDRRGKNGMIARAVSYTDSRCCSSDFMVQQAADHIGLSKNYFLTLFRQETGQRFWDHVTQVRMEKAKQLLRQTDKTLYEISIIVGYESEYHFSRKFKQVVGIKASEYRKNVRPSDD